MYKTTLFISIALSLLSCNNQQKGDSAMVVKVFDKTLYLSEVANVVPDNSTTKDSADIAQRYVKQWISNQLVLRKAMFNVGDKNPEIEKQVEDYRDAIIIKKYTEELFVQVDQSDPTPIEIEEYYQANRKKFVLSQPVVTGMLIVLPSASPKKSDLLRWVKANDAASLARLQEYCVQYATVYDDFTSKWLSFSDISKVLPSINVDDFLALQHNPVYINEDVSNTYILKVNELIPANEPAPSSYVTQSIKSILQYQKEETFFQKFENDLYSEGVKNQTIVFNPRYE